MAAKVLLFFAEFPYPNVNMFIYGLIIFLVRANRTLVHVPAWLDPTGRSSCFGKDRIELASSANSAPNLVS